MSWTNRIDGTDSVDLRRRSSMPIPHARGHMYGRLAASCRPRPAVGVSAWADRHRVLTSKGSGEAGPWRTARVPFAREIMDCLSVHSPVQRVVLRFAAQMTKTEIGLNWLGYVMHHAPAPMLVVLPTLEVRKRWVRQRLDPMLDETPVIRTLFDSRRKRDAGNSEDLKDFPGGLLVIAGANSPASLASMPIRYVLCDEVDRFPWEAGIEGDPLGLIEERTKTFPRRKILLVSTPTTKGLSRIDDEYEASDQRRYEVPCPHCGHYQSLVWRRGDQSLSLHRVQTTGRMYYQCANPACGEGIAERDKTEMLAAGRWIPRYPERPVRGYTLSGLYSPLGLGFTWAEIWDKWEDAHGDTAKLKRFINTNLGEAYVEEGDEIDPLGLLARLEDYPETRMGSVRTAGADVQGDRIEVSIYDWGTGEECWAQEHIILPGDTALDQVYGELAEVCQEYGVDVLALDAGYRTTQVNAFCVQHGWAYAVMGRAGPGRPITEDARKLKQRLRHRRRRGAPIYFVGVDQAKALLFARLKLRARGPGFVHFPNRAAFDDEFFAQLAAEKLVTKERGGRPFEEWVKTRTRNEALDCAVYALAAMRLSARTPGAPRPPRPDAQTAPRGSLPDLPVLNHGGD